MSSTSNPTDDGPVSSVLITGPIDSLLDLATASGVDIVRGSIEDFNGETRSAVAYVTAAALSNLQASGIAVTPLVAHVTRRARWSAQAQFE